MSVVEFKRERKASHRVRLHNTTNNYIIVDVERALDDTSFLCPCENGFILTVNTGQECLVEMQPWDVAVAKQKGITIEEVQP